jgi:hypothetical protein
VAAHGDLVQSAWSNRDIAARIYVQQAIIDKPVPLIDAGEYSLPSLLMKVAVETGVPIGLELAGDEPGKPALYRGNQASVSLSRVLDEIIKSPYAWKENGGVINVFPKEEPTEVFHTEIASFEARDALPIEMLQSLLKEPVIAGYLSQRRITAATWVTGSVPVNRSSISIQNLSFRAALNKIVLVAGRPGWTAFYQTQHGRQYLWFQLW